MGPPSTVLRSLAAPGHWMMLAGAGLDQWRGAGGGLCLSAPSLDPALLLWEAQNCPGMLIGMALGLAMESAGPTRRSLLSSTVAMIAGFLAMVQGGALTGGMAGAGVAAMVVAMLVSDAVMERLGLARRQARPPRQGRSTEMEIFKKHSSGLPLSS